MHNGVDSASEIWNINVDVMTRSVQSTIWIKYCIDLNMLGPCSGYVTVHACKECVQGELIVNIWCETTLDSTAELKSIM